jgi:hypothetical protein
MTFGDVDVIALVVNECNMEGGEVTVIRFDKPRRQRP